MLSEVHGLRLQIQVFDIFSNSRVVKIWLLRDEGKHHLTLGKNFVCGLCGGLRVMRLVYEFFIKGDHADCKKYRSVVGCLSHVCSRVLEEGGVPVIIILILSAALSVV
jgi:hypothetical protein